MRGVGAAVLLTVLMLTFTGGLWAQQDVVKAKADYARTAKQAEEIVKKMKDPNITQEEWNKLKQELDKCNQDLIRLQGIIESDQATNKKIKEALDLYNAGKNAYDAGRYADALVKLKEAVTKATGINTPTSDDISVRAYFYIAYCFYKQNKPVDMIEPLNLALKIKPNFYNAINLLAQSYDAQRRPELAIEQYQKSIGINNTKDNMSAYTNLATIYYQQKDYKNAIDISMNAFAIDPKNYKPIYLIGRSYFETKDFPNAKNALEKAIELDSTKWESHHYLSQSYNLLGKYEDAMREAQKVLKLHPQKNPRYGGALIEIGRAYKGLGDKLKALEYFTEAKKDPDPAIVQLADWEIKNLQKGDK
jgi:tetratricopeptide (TPR) repeat protein